MSRLVIAAALVASLSASAAAAATAPPPPRCGPSLPMIAALADQFGERVAFGGLAGDGNGMPLVVLVAPGGATFSILVMPSPGVVCLIAAGRDWRAAAPRPESGR